MKKKRIGRKILIIILVLLALAQLIQPKKNQGNPDGPQDVTHALAVPPEVHSLLKKSCYDCHSENTVYPWYDNITPVNWWVADHVKEGKAELNFTSFSTYSPKKMDKKLEEIAETVEKKEMPLKSYLITHTDAKLTDEQRKILIEWAERTRDSLKLP